MWDISCRVRLFFSENEMRRKEKMVNSHRHTCSVKVSEKANYMVCMKHEVLKRERKRYTSWPLDYVQT